MKDTRHWHVLPSTPQTAQVRAFRFVVPYRIGKPDEPNRSTGANADVFASLDFDVVTPAALIHIRLTA